MCDDLMLASDDIRAGLIPGMTFGYRPVVYAVVDGMAIFEGCIVLGTAEEVEQVTADIRRAIENAGDGDRENVEHGVGITGQAFRWPDRVIPYTIAPTLPNQARVTEAIAHWEAHTDIRFVPRTRANESQYPNFVNFTPGQGCSSQVGMRLGGQNINLADGCFRGAVIHEIGHAVGLWHEQSREDRDQFVQINFQNVLPNRRHNFNQHISDGDDIGDYDFESIMHYGPTAFSKNGRQTIVPLVQGVTLRQRNVLSAGDIATVKAMYPGDDPEITSPAPGSQLANSTVTFVWSANGEPVTQWWLYVGARAGKRDYFNSGSLGTRLSTVVTGLPADQSQIHVRLWFKVGSTWEFDDVQYTAARSGNPAITAPIPGSALQDSNATFDWTANGAPVTQWWLYVGSTVGGRDHFNSGALGARLSAPVSGLPTDGSQIHVRLWHMIQGNWRFSDFQYTAATSNTPQITSPAPGSVLSGSTVTFQWAANGSTVVGWWMYIGDNVGADDWYNSGWLGTGTSTTVNGLPTDGRTIHVRLQYLSGGNWQTADVQYTAAT